MYNPVSTYRIQFHKGFTFDHFEGIIPYLADLGVKTIYASPVFAAVPGSMHGYDGINPLSINPEIGTIAQLRKISKKLKEKNIGWIQDIVPNHMAFDPGNEWLMDLLEKGPGSDYRAYFDQSLDDDFFEGPLMVPFLGDDLEKVIAAGELRVKRKAGTMVFDYMGTEWPLRRDSYPGKLVLDTDELRLLADKQYYRLCSWKETDSKINFRRFFTVNSLICLKMQDEQVFAHYHGLINQLLKEGIIDGLRIDHIDGLFDPAVYLQRLRKLCGSEAYIIVEKILEPGEQMPGWPVQGNTGYDFLATVNNLLTNKKSRAAFTSFYKELTLDNLPVNEQIIRKKAFILQNQMAGELDNLAGLLPDDDDSEDLKKVLAEFLVRCPVYRYYGNRLPLEKAEHEAVQQVFDGIEQARPELARAVKTLKLWLDKGDKKALYFYRRCMQFTGPLMAKGVEDTLMYTYNRFIAHNEVGDAPSAFGIAVDEFHSQMVLRQASWPLTMNGTSTHDTKRGEDARARLNVLTDLPDEWFELVNKWRAINKATIDPNDEYFIYETIAGTYPMPGQPEDNYPERIAQYLEKTLREAKLRSGWAQPAEDYERSVKDFAAGLLDKKSRFWTSFAPFHQKISLFGAANSIVQLLLKLTVPGVPDIYQGCELWDFSMVDPDNRRPVDYAQRSSYLQLLEDPSELWKTPFDGRAKLRLLQLILQERKENPLVFAEGIYLPLKIKGQYSANVVAYARQYRRVWYIIIAPVGMASLGGDLNPDWGDTAIVIPENIPGDYVNLLSNVPGKAAGDILLSAVFSSLPLAFLKFSLPGTDRGSGVLAHITSLPSPFGQGDFGPGATAFADLLHRCGQKYWQLLPLSPVDAKSQFSPYSSWSAMGGNTLLISLELLQEEGLLTNIKTGGKPVLLETAWNNFQNGACPWLIPEFNGFCKSEVYWLDEFALYVVLKAQHNGKAWYEWPAKFKSRNKAALAEFEAKHRQQLAQVKWGQFLFTRQWLQLKQHCNRLDIALIGDLPFYISRDSVDVWANPELFAIDKNGKPEMVAGVPPDYFNAGGQLWGMPVFNWAKLKAQNYRWWVQRIRKNMDLFDLLRLDHFRAFSSYWAVPAGEETAINGSWVKGPGEDFFNMLKKEMGDLPFIAEDLGDIDEEVYLLRDKFGLPGMKVLQFAFGSDMPVSPHIPHNYTPNHVAYTGTHDNNTAKGWYKNEAGAVHRGNLKAYSGFKVNADNVGSVLVNMVTASAAKIAIYPLQDLLGLDETARMNTPAETIGNWQWRVTKKQLKTFPVQRLLEITGRYNRL